MSHNTLSQETTHVHVTLEVTPRERNMLVCLLHVLRRQPIQFGSIEIEYRDGVPSDILPHPRYRIETLLPQLASESA